MADEQIKDAIGDLTLFSFGEFCLNKGVTKDLVAELPVYRAIICKTDELFWSQVDVAAKYGETLKKKAEKNPDKYNGNIWCGHCIEKARRV